MIIKKSRGVSNVIGVILMIVLVIIVGAIITTFAIELAGSLDDPIQAGVDVEEDYNAIDGTYDVTVVWQTEGTVDEVMVREPDGSQTSAISDVGEEIEVTNLEEGDTIRIIGLVDGSEGVIQEYDIGS